MYLSQTLAQLSQSWLMLAIFVILLGLIRNAIGVSLSCTWDSTEVTLVLLAPGLVQMEGFKVLKDF